MINKLKSIPDAKRCWPISGQVCLIVLTLFVKTVSARGDLIVNAFDIPFTVDFESFTGAGWQPGGGGGTIDSNTFSATGFSDGEIAFGDTATSGDFARGSSTGEVSTGGVYAFDTGSGANAAAGGTGSIGLGVQPTGSDFTAGSITLKILNATGSNASAWSVSYDIFALNDQNRANSLNFSFSVDGNSFTAVPALDFSSIAPADATPTWTRTLLSTSISQTVASGSNLFLRWTGSDLSGTGGRDEFVLDNISVTASPEPGSIMLTTIALAAFAGCGLKRRRRLDRE